MDVQFRWTESDYFAAQLAWLYRRPWKFLFEFWYSIAFLGIVVAALIERPDNWRDELLGVPLAILIAVPRIFWSSRAWHRQFKKAYSTDAEFTATIDERGVTLAAEGQRETYSWLEFSRIYDFLRVVVFEKGAGRFLFLPKAAMSGAQLNELRRLALAVSKCKVRLAAPAG